MYVKYSSYEKMFLFIETKKKKQKKNQRRGTINDFVSIVIMQNRILMLRDFEPIRIRTFHMVDEIDSHKIDLPNQDIFVISICSLSDLGVSSSLIGLLSRSN